MSNSRCIVSWSFHRDVVGHQAEPFDDPDWIYEIKHDGFRALAVIEQEHCRLFFRKKHRLTGYEDLRTALVREVRAETAILDGELAVADRLGRTMFADLIKQRKAARYFAFDLLWPNGEDLRQPALAGQERKTETHLTLTQPISCMSIIPAEAVSSYIAWPAS